MASEARADICECRLTITRRADCEAFLQQVRFADLLVKTQQAELALSLRQMGASTARQVLSELSGHQGFSKKLDDLGCSVFVRGR